MQTIKHIQLGKQGITNEFIEALRSRFKNCERDREKIKQISEKIIHELGKNFTCKIIGFTLVIRKWRKDKR